MELTAKIQRKFIGDSIIGTLAIYDREQNEIFICDTLELLYNENKKNISSIPKGTYTVTRRFSAKFKKHLYINLVPNRDLILIHVGNTKLDSKGCILVGNLYIDSILEKNFRLTDSRKTLEKILQINFTTLKLTIC